MAKKGCLFLSTATTPDTTVTCTPKLECCKLPKSWEKTRVKKRPLYVMDIMLQTLHYGHHIIDIILWTLGLHDFNYGNPFGSNKCYMYTNFVQIYHIQFINAFD